MPRAKPRDEDGAVMLIVASSLVALVGMLVLVVDLGSLIAERRVMVRAADAAALSAAQECVRFGPLNAEYRADQFAEANESAATGGIVEGGDCLLGQVRVEYEVSKGLFFAPIFGAGFDDATVSAAAVVSWSNPRTLPVSLDMGPAWDARFYTCPMPPTPANCLTFPRFWVLFDNDHLSTGVWGFFSNDDGIPNRWFNTLYPPTPEQCGGSVPTSTFDVPAWACADTGVGEWQQWWRQDLLQVGHDYVLPLNDRKVGPPEAPNAFHVVGFLWARVFHVDTTLNPHNGGTCGEAPGPVLVPLSNSSNTCIGFTWVSGGLGSMRPIRLVG